jgi:uncharacterized peroxidase-related enzyme
MPRIAPVDPTTAAQPAAGLLAKVERALGTTPNMMRTMAASPAVLDAYLSFSGALSKGRLSAAVQEQLALTVAAANSCEYCLAAHTVLGSRAGVSAEDLAAGPHAEAGDDSVSAALRFARRVAETRGFVSDEDLKEVRAAGHGDPEIAEIVAAVALNSFTNYFNSVAQTELDFPAVPLPAGRH